MRRNLLRIALEEASDGRAHRECEHTFYGRIEDFSVLDQAASMEHHEQWEVRVPKTEANGGKGRFRVRKTIIDGKVPEYVLTCKTKIGDTGDELEVSVPTTEPMFEQFKLMSEQGMIKDRYHFPVEGSDLVWEVDMFYLPGAEVGSRKYFSWCKIDLEVDNRNTPIPGLPFEFAEIIMAEEGNRTADEEAQVRRLYDTEFNTRNVHLPS
jgi:CYTH domain-containing protein